MAININRINQNTNYNIKTPEVKRNYSGIKMAQTQQATGFVGDLIPIFCRELIPGQKITLNFTSGIQFTPFVTNLMHEFNGEILTYFVPYRLLWDDWENFITGGKDGLWTAELPKITGTVEKYDIEDYLGFPLLEYKNEDEVKVSSFPRQAYNLIWNEQLRNLDIEKEVDKNNKKLIKGKWNFDYFNTARIAQMRGAIPTIPISASEAKIHIKNNMQYVISPQDASSWGITLTEEEKNKYYTKEELLALVKTKSSRYSDWERKVTSFIEEKFAEKTKNGIQIYSNNSYLTKANGNTLNTGKSANILNPSSGIIYNDEWGIRLDDSEYNMKGLFENAGIKINDFITALGITKFQVNNMRVKPRYMEQLKMRFGISPTDERMQLPEYIGMNNIEVNTTMVTQTAPTSGGTQQGVGDISGQAFGGTSGQSVSYKALEWGLIMSLMVIKPMPVYELGIPKMWSKKDKFDFATPELENMLDVPLYNYELNFSESNRTRKKVFGWRGIYDDYRVAHNLVCADMRPSVSGGLSTYNLAMKLPENVQLNSEFLQVNADMKRVKQYTNQPDFIYFMKTDITTAIPLTLQPDPEKMIL